MGNEIERTPSVLDITLKNKPNEPPYIARKFHDDLSEWVPFCGTAVESRFHVGAWQFFFGQVWELVAILWDGEEELFAAHRHEFFGVIVFVNVPFHIVLETHQETSTVTRNHVRVSRTYTQGQQCWWRKEYVIDAPLSLRWTSPPPSHATRNRECTTSLILSQNPMLLDGSIRCFVNFSMTCIIS